MKCPSCGYFNLPGLAQCGSCGLALQTSTEGVQQPAQWSEVLPPRAKDRSHSQRVEQGLGRPYRVARKTAGRTREEWRQAQARYGNQFFNLGLSLRDWLMILGALVPGLPQALRKRWTMAAVLSGAMAVALLSLRLSFYSALFDLVLLFCLAILAFSVWDTAQDVAPAASVDKAAVRSWRLAFLSISIVASLCTTSLTLLSFRYASARLQAGIGAPLFLNDDYLLVERLAETRQLRHGDVVVAGYQIDRVLGLPGDRIEGREGQLWVNGVLVAKANLPLLFQYPAPNFSETVPQGSIALWQQGRGYFPNENWEGAPLAIQDFDAIEGRVTAIHAPAERRQWVE